MRCAWCGRRFDYAGRGRPPSYCRRACRLAAKRDREVERRAAARSASLRLTDEEALAALAPPGVIEPSGAG
jgi:hypothetical protein